MFEQVESTTKKVEEPISLAPADLLRQEIDQVSYVYNIIVDFFANYTFQLIGAFIIFALGYMLAGKISKVVLNLCTKHKLDITLSQFLASTTKMLIVIMITVISLSKLGISVTPFIAAIVAVSLGAGLALQGLLANYAACFNIIIIRPFINTKKSIIYEYAHIFKIPYLNDTTPTWSNRGKFRDQFLKSYIKLYELNLNLLS